MCFSLLAYISMHKKVTIVCKQSSLFYTHWFGQVGGPAACPMCIYKDPTFCVVIVLADQWLSG